jgi:dynein light intermediate chain 2
MEYAFGRRTRGHQGAKDLVHIYELSGGKDLSSLLKIPITELNLHLSSFAIVVDLSKPDQALDIVEHFLITIRDRLSNLMTSLESRGSKRPSAMKSYAWKRFGTEHPDSNTINPLSAPVLIIGTKYDVFKNLEPERKKLFCKTMRFIAHQHGASIVFSSNDDASNSKTKQFLSSMAFKTNPPKTTVMDHNKPLMIHAGQDAFSQIGVPPSLQSDIVGKQQICTIDDWKADFFKYFPSFEGF